MMTILTCLIQNLRLESALSGGFWMLAGKSALNRLELGAGTSDRYKLITFWI